MNCGEKLEMLRKARQNRAAKQGSREHIANLAGIETRSLALIELGTTQQPSREVLEKILNALDHLHPLLFFEKQEILQCYGYKSSFPIPTQSEIEWAKSEWRKVYETISFPAYLVDCIHRLLDWNEYAPRLLGLLPSSPELNVFKDKDVLDLLFQIAPQYVEILHAHEYIYSLIKTMKSEFALFVGEPWINDWINRAGKRYPQFRTVWNSIPDSVSTPIIGNQVPLVLKSPHLTKPLIFHLTAVRMSGDPRFTIAQYIPFDDFTNLQCMLWRSERTK